MQVTKSWKSLKGAVLTGIVLVFSLFLMSMAGLFIQPIQKNYREILPRGEKMRRHYLAEAGWVYLAHQWKAGKIKLGKSLEIKREISLEGKERGWFRLQVSLDSGKSKVYNVSVWSGFLDKGSQEPVIWGRFKIEGEKLRVVGWKLK